MSAKWRACYSAAFPKFWGIETTDPSALERGEETIVAPCMPEHAAKTIVDAYNVRLALAVPSQHRQEGQP